MSKAGKMPFTERALAQLTLVRFREFIREPEVLFWVFVFPILLAAGLGLAFRNRPPEVLKIAATTAELARSLAGEKLLRVEHLPQAEAEEALRVGKVALVAGPGANGAVVYGYDPTNPEGRTARMLADGAVECAAGRIDPVASTDRLLEEPGSRYIDFLIPGLVGMNLMGSAMWGIGFTIVDARRKKLIKRMVATPMPRHYYLLSFILSRLCLLVVEVGVVVSVGAPRFVLACALPAPPLHPSFPCSRPAAVGVLAGWGRWLAVLPPSVLPLAKTRRQTPTSTT